MAADSRDWLMSRLTQQRQQQPRYDYPDPDVGVSNYVSDLTAAPSFYSSGSVDGYAVHSLDDECCPAVVDKATFLGTLAFIVAGATYLVTLLLTNALVNGLNLQNLLNALNLAGLTAALQNVITQAQTAITGLTTQVTGLITTITGLIPGKRSLAFSPAFMAGTDTDLLHHLSKIFSPNRCNGGPPLRFRASVVACVSHVSPHVFPASLASTTGSFFRSFTWLRGGLFWRLPLFG